MCLEVKNVAYNTSSRYETSKIGGKKWNSQGVRFYKKLSNGVYKHYYLDGSKILGEDWDDGTKLRYFYDATGLCGLSYNGENYTYYKDSFGNITGIVSAKTTDLLGIYQYDAFGGCKLLDKNGNQFSSSVPEVLKINPFRWKSQYYDIEIDLYYIDGRYYDPKIMQYINAASPESILLNAFIINGLNRYGITTTNTIRLIAAIYTIFTSTQLYTDKTYKRETHWTEYILPAMMIVAGLILLVSGIGGIFSPAMASFFVAAINVGINAAISGLIIGGITGGLSSAANGNNFWSGAAQGAVEGALSGFATGVILFSVFSGIGAIKDTIGKSKAVKLAKAAQGQGAYPGIDDWIGVKLEEGTIVWGGTPGQTGFYTTDNVMQLLDNDATKIFKGLQVGKGGPAPISYRPGMTMYRVTKSTYAAYSHALANTVHGAGGLPQYFIPTYAESLKPLLTRILINR